MFAREMKSRILLGIQQKMQMLRNTAQVVDIRFVSLASLKYSTCLIQTIVLRVYHIYRNTPWSWRENCF